MPRIFYSSVKTRAGLPEISEDRYAPIRKGSASTRSWLIFHIWCIVHIVHTQKNCAHQTPKKSNPEWFSCKIFQGGRERTRQTQNVLVDFANTDANKFSHVKYVSGQHGEDIMENSARGIWKYSFICKFMDFFPTKLRTWTKECFSS